VPTLGRGDRRSNVSIRATAGLRSIWPADKLLCMFGGVGGGRKFSETLDGSVGETGEHMSQVFADGHAETSAALDDGEDGGDFWAGLFAADMQPVLAPDRDGAHGVLGEVGR
jgi:hypothetical protein